MSTFTAPAFLDLPRLEEGTGRRARTARPRVPVDFRDGTLSLPDAADATAVQAVIDAHAPLPDTDADFRAALTGATTVAQIRDALLGTKGPGAEPRRGR